MDPSDSDIIFLEEVNGKQSESIACSGNSDSTQTNGEIPKDDILSSCNNDDLNEDVPDFDDLEVLDCWEEVEETSEETDKNEPTTEKVDEHISKSNPAKVQSKGDGGSNSTKSKSSEEPSKIKRIEDSSKHKSRSGEELKKTSKTDKIVTVDTLTSVDKPKTACNNNLKEKKDEQERVHNKQDTKTSNNKDTGDLPSRKKSSENVEIKNTQNTSKKSSSPTLATNARQSSSAEHKNSSRRSHESSKDNETPYKSLPNDTTETKVDRFLKEMARQNPHISSLKETSSHDDKLLEAISSDSSKHSSLPSPPGLDLSDLPPGVDLDQVTEDTGTSLLATATRQSQTQTSRANQESSKGTNREKKQRSKSPHSKNQEGRISASAPRRESSHESFSLSPSPTPRSRRLSPSTAQYSRVPPNFSYMASNAAPGYSERPLYPNPAHERNRFPTRDPILRELSRSLSRERIRHRSRSRSRDRTFARRRSRSRHRYSSKDEHYRRYRRSSSHSRSPTRRGRSRSRSQSRHQYSSKRSPLWDDDQRSKRPRLSRSISRSRSPWKSHVESEWHTNYSDGKRNPPLDEEGKLEHDMARFIATNIAATGLRPPVTNVAAWFDPGVKPQDVIPSKSPPTPEPPVIGDRGMPLPPPPPDISELMTPEEIKETRTQQEMSPVPPVSLSSLLESAVTGFPEKVIIDRCQDAIMKLHDVSIKPGRFAVISTIKVPQAEPSSTFQPWQSVLNRSLASKIHLSFSKLCEQPVYWKPKPILRKTAPGSSSHSLIIPVSSTADMDRSALLEKIFLLTRELQEVRRVLDHRSSPKIHRAVQTSLVTYCDSCGIEMDSERRSSASGFQSNSSLMPQPVPPQSVRQPQPVPPPQSASLPQPVPPPQSMRQHQSVQQPGAQSLRQPHAASVPLALRPPQPVPPPQSASLPQPVQAPLQVPPPKPVPAPALKQNTSQASLLGPPPIAGPSQTINWCVSNQPGPSSAASGASSSQSHAPFSSTAVQQQSRPNQPGKQAKNSTIPSLMSIVPGAEINKKTAKNKTVPLQKATPLLSTPKPPTLKDNRPMTAADYEIDKYLMVGDEHMHDLILYYRNHGKNIHFDSKFVSSGLNIDLILKNVISSADNLQSQVILYFGMYDANYNSKTLAKFKQLIGYLKKRCKHVVVIEPPPIPKHMVCKTAWHSFSQMENSFPHFKSENVSLVKIMSMFLTNTNVPKNALFSDSLRVNMSGLRLIAEALENVIVAARNAKFRQS